MGMSDSAGARLASGALPVLAQGNYYRASKLGEGSYGSVVTVYDEEGRAFAAKMFDQTDEDQWEQGSETGSEEEWTAQAKGGIDGGVLRELSMLRLLNGSHPNIMRLVDVTTLEDSLCMIMPRASCSLGDAIERQTLTGAEKLSVGTLMLHVLAFLASHGIMHRDIKPDNILLDERNSPILTDFSLSKMIDSSQLSESVAKSMRSSTSASRQKRSRKDQEGKANTTVHTTGQGTPTYTAPEVVHGGNYGLKADVWSLGVVLYEMFNGALLDHVKDKRAIAHLEEVSAKLSDRRPVPATMKRMLQINPSQRASAADALELIKPAGKVELPKCALPLDMALIDPCGRRMAEHSPPRKKGKGGRPAGASASLTPAHACELLGFASSMTARVAESNWRRSAAARERGAVGAACCALLASKIYEVEVYNPDHLVDLHASLDEYDPDDYAKVEQDILHDLGFCMAAP